MAAATVANPLDVVRANLGSTVRVLLRTGGGFLSGVATSTTTGSAPVVGLEGGLVAIDAAGNVVLKDVRELIEGPEGGKVTTASSGVAAAARFIRGDCVVAVTAVPK